MYSGLSFKRFTICIIYSGKDGYTSSYGEDVGKNGDFTEDFADSVSEFVNKPSFKTLYPNKAKILEQIIRNQGFVP